MKLKPLLWTGLICLLLSGCTSLQNRLVNDAKDSLRIIVDKVGCEKRNTLSYQARSGERIFYDCGTGYTLI